MPVSGRSELVDVDGELMHQTAKAWLVKVHGPGEEREVWIPKSIGQAGRSCTFTVPLWFAEREELV